MPTQPMLLTVDASGEVVAANEAASELLGAFAGRHCCDVVRGSDDRGAAVCTATCPQRLMAGARARDHVVNVRDGHWRFVCTPMGRSVVVQGFPEARATTMRNLLTPREQEVLGLVAEGLNSAAIGQRLGISAATVRTHVEHAREKLGARTRAEAVARLAEMPQKF